MAEQTDLSLYDRVAHETASVVIRRYSTSFGLASRLLRADIRVHVENIYALVRIADEIVDGVAAGAQVPHDEISRLLDDLERETHSAVERGYSTNLVVHAFALTARSAGFGRELVAPFFASMRRDLSPEPHTAESFDAYVYGSAEVVGLMCLRAFLLDERGAERAGSLAPGSYAASGAAVAHPEPDPALIDGARHLGAAFQKVNFLRDLAADYRALGRSYFPGVDVASFDEHDKNRLLDDIDDDLRVSAATLPRLPASSRRAVALAQSLFTELAVRLRETPAQQIATSRVRVPNPVKLRLAAEAAVGRTPRSAGVGAPAVPSRGRNSRDRGADNRSTNVRGANDHRSTESRSSDIRPSEGQSA
ncbi:phytoene/squalene synthase family protein [Planctomonas deserti]|uniref:phytoene/squalene synthase family protein n=1 Tax=Planctomonas deserti TaxID=2144185 RepID=UPI000D3997B4|nr:squalene/phytoene synthase family protein [Planctomonas deserti]